MKRIAKIVTGIAVVGALVFVGGGATYANDLYSGFNKTLPLGSIGVLAGGSQNKYVSNKSGDISVTSVGSNYKVQAQMTDIIGTGNTYKTAALDDGNTAKLKNTFVSNTDTAMSIWVSTWNGVTVSATGKWRSY